MDMDNGGPVEIKADKVRRREGTIYDAVENFSISYLYPEDIKMRMFSTQKSSEWGTKFIGSEGSIYVENHKLITTPPELKRKKLQSNDERLYVSENHHRNFVDCVITRKKTAASVESAHRAASACHLGAIAAKLGRRLKFDPQKENFINDKDADALLMRKFHGGWKLS